MQLRKQNTKNRLSIKFHGFTANADGKLAVLVLAILLFSLAALWASLSELQVGSNYGSKTESKITKNETKIRQ